MMNLKTCFFKTLSVCLCLLVLLSALPAFAYENKHYTNEELYDIWSKTDERKNTMLEQYLDTPFPPVGDGTTSSWADSGYTLAAYYLNQNTEEADRVLLTSLETWPISTKSDNYFPIQLLIRTWYFFRKDSTFFPGRMSAAAEKKLEASFWEFVCDTSDIGAARNRSENEIDIEGSENHDFHRRCNVFLALQMFNGMEAYRDKKLPDGNTVAQHFYEWNEYYKWYLDFKIKKGLSIEESSKTYMKYNWAGIFNLRDLAYSDVLREKADMFLDVLFANFSIKLGLGFEGGPANRQYHDKFCNYNITTTPDTLSWLFFGRANDEEAFLSAGGTHPTHLCFATSSYRVPSLLMELGLNLDERGTYTYTTHLLGRGEGYVKNAEWSYTVKTPSDQISTTYVTPDYIVGSITHDRAQTYTALTTQNRMMYIDCIGPNHTIGSHSRVYALCEATHAGGVTNYNAYSGVSHESAMIVQRNPDGESESTGILFIFMSQDLYDVKTTQNGWLFTYDPDGNTYIAIKPSKGKFTGEDSEYSIEKYKSGRLLSLSSPGVPIVFQAARASDYESFDAFIRDVSDNEFTWVDEETFRYTGCGTSGTLLWHTDTRLPEINGKTVDVCPPKLLDSPYLESDFESGIVTMRNYSGQELVYDFNITHPESFAEAACEPKEWEGSGSGTADSPDSDEAAANYTITVNNKKINFKNPAPIERDGRLLVPLRALGNALGAETAWNVRTATATLLKDNTAISVTIGSPILWCEGDWVELDTAPVLHHDRTMIPLRAVAEALGATVTWTAEGNKIEITLPA